MAAMNKYIIDWHIFDDGTMIDKVRHDINGNPRYIVHFAYINDSYDKALAAAKEVGFHKCTKDEFRHFFICQSYGGFQEVYNKVMQAQKIIEGK